MRRATSPILFLVPFLLLTSLPTIHAQVDPGPCPGCWRNYIYDGRFIIGAHNSPDLEEWANLFTLDFAQYYAANTRELRQQLDTTVNIYWDPDPSHPWGGTWRTTDPIGTTLLDTATYLTYAHKSLIPKQALENGVKLYYHPDAIPDIMKGAMTREHHYVLPSGHQQFAQGEKIFGGTSFDFNWLRANLDTLRGGFFWVHSLPSSTVSDTATLMAGRPDWIIPAAEGGYSGIYDNAFHITRDASGTLRNTAARDSMKALYDRTEWISLGFSIKADITLLSDPEIHDTTVIAYADLFLRDTLTQLDTLYALDSSGQVVDTIVTNGSLSQDDCRCRIFQPRHRLNITKSFYLERANFDLTVDSRYIAHKDGTQSDRTPWYVDVDSLFDFTGQLPLFRGTNILGSSGTINVPTSTPCVTWCDSIAARRMALPDSLVTIIRHSPTDIDTLPARLAAGSYNDVLTPAYGEGFTYKFYTRHIVPLSYLRGRLATAHYINLREGRYDSLITGAIDAIYADPRLDSLTGRIGVGDEPEVPTFRAHGLLSYKAQRAIDAQVQNGKKAKQLWINPANNFDGLRLFTGDFDSVGYRQVHMAARQQYKFNGGDPIPLYYANLDSLSAMARDTMFKFYRSDWIKLTINIVRDPITEDSIGVDTTRRDTMRLRMVVGPNESDHRYYRTCIQTQALGVYLDSKSEDAFHHGPLVKSVSRLASVFRDAYSQRFPNLPKTPIWNAIQVHGFVPLDQYNSGDATYTGFGAERTVTPEEISVQAWLTMNCGANGLLFGDLQYDGATFGLGSIWADSSRREMEYGRQRWTNLFEQSDITPDEHIDSMWLGWGSRRRAMFDVIRDLRYIDTAVGWKNLVSNRYQISVHDTRQNFAEIPMIVDLSAEKAKRHDYSIDTNGVWTFQASDTIDVRNETFMEATIFYPEPASGYVSGERFLLLTNRLTWPVDTSHYSQPTVDRFDSIHGWFPINAVGLGAIDVRRAHVVLENNTDLIADSALIERISPTSQWSTTAAFGDTVMLEWMLPGRGHMYKITPLAGGISDHGTAYNNAVHSENPTSPTRPLDRLVVYERDSIVYIRAVDSSGSWSSELMVSHPADTIINSSGKRRASNFFPAVAVSRGIDGVARVVWERRDSSGYRSIMTAQFAGHTPLYRSSIDSLAVGLGSGTIERHRLSGQDTLSGPPALTPSIVAVNDTTGGAGFIVAWAGHSTGTSLLALREYLFYSDIDAADSTGLYDLRYELMGFDVCQYPTLASVSRYMDFNTNHGFTSGTAVVADTNDPTPFTVPVPPGPWRRYFVAHLAYQQGDGTDGFGEHIFYHRLGVRFPSVSFDPPSLFASKYPERVDTNIAACSFEHPSIASDSVRVGVAFEIVEENNVQRNIGLRFRDTVGIDTTTSLPLKAWQSYVYRWGGPLKPSFLKFYVTGSIYERPSLTHFPSMGRDMLRFLPEGGISWFWRDGPSGRAHPQFLYRYGWFEPREIGDGKHPSLTLVPLLADEPFAQSSVLHRGDNASRVAGVNDEGESVWYYSGRLLNTPGNPMPTLFSGVPATGGIFARATIAPLGWNPCIRIKKYDYGLVFAHGTTTHPKDDRHGPGDPSEDSPVPGLPPKFFVSPTESPTIIETLPDALDVVRTSLFVTNNDVVKVRRFVAAGDSLTQWLDSFGWDSVKGTEADIWSVVELVKSDDMTILWRSDTLSARVLDTMNIEVDETLSIPAGDVADSGTKVFVQMRTFASDSVSYMLSAGFTFFREDSLGSSPKRVMLPEEVKSTGGEAVMLSLSVIPNPARDRAELNVWTAQAGAIRVTVWSLSGERIGDLPTIDAKLEGTYRIEVDLEGVSPGSYLIRAESGRSVATETVTVVR